MSLLPQRKKSTEEIAKLRESLGIPGISPAETTTAPPAEAAPSHHGPRQVHSLKRSERNPDAASAEPLLRSVTTAPQPQVTKLDSPPRKSAQGRIATPTVTDSASHSKLPEHRHTDQELNELRRREAIAMLAAAKPDPRLARAHPILLIPGYLLAFAGALCFYDYQLPLNAAASCAAAALLIAAFVCLRRPLSRHHAAFIAVITLFVIVFGALHYFPQLQHAT
jgi:hypothetical protein